MFVDYTVLSNFSCDVRNIQSHLNDVLHKEITVRTQV